MKPVAAAALLGPRHRFCRECQRAAKRRYYRRKREVMANV